MANAHQAGLVLEGGGMRGLYTAGVLDYFAEKDLYFPYQIGVSAGACMAVSYLSRQKGRNRRVNTEFAGDPRYLSWRKFLRHRQELFGMDFIFDEIPRNLIPFDFQTFHASPEEFVIVVTDIETGQPVYYRKSEGFSDDELMKLLRASSSLPFFAPVVEYQGRKLMDGGIADPIPIRKAEADGCHGTVLILTRNMGYVKKKTRISWLLKRKFAQYPEFVNVMLNRHHHYNDTIRYIHEQEQAGSAFVIRPREPMKVGRTEQNREKLEHLYMQGYTDAQFYYPKLMEWLASKKQ